MVRSVIGAVVLAGSALLAAPQQAQQVDVTTLGPQVGQRAIEFRMGDGREVRVEFAERDGGVQVTETFDAESVYPPEFQRQGWQAILDKFGQHVERRSAN